jgi:hypothetical protein
MKLIAIAYEKYRSTMQYIGNEKISRKRVPLIIALIEKTAARTDNRNTSLSRVLWLKKIINDQKTRTKARLITCAKTSNPPD